MSNLKLNTPIDFQHTYIYFSEIYGLKEMPKKYWNTIFFYSNEKYKTKGPLLEDRVEKRAISFFISTQGFAIHVSLQPQCLINF